EKEDYAIVLFNSTAMTLKKINQQKSSLKIIDDILDSEAVGFTNIHLGLEKGLKELNKTREARKNRFGILISDGVFNRGKNPIEIAKLYPRLHVIGMPAENDAAQGIRTCREIADAGGGKFYAVTDYKEIPRALMQLLTHA
ncbi:MAG: VWA domain-containing protein, partial [Candidatus Lokiarchaeota archaeon]|nr:VWA domain-containing protein [Candidatus Lokiarchaeota archaeon]